MTIPLVVGRRIAQIVFFETEGTENGSSYEQSGKYERKKEKKRSFLFFVLILFILFQDINLQQLLMS